MEKKELLQHMTDLVETLIEEGADLEEVWNTLYSALPSIDMVQHLKGLLINSGLNPEAHRFQIRRGWNYLRLDYQEVQGGPSILAKIEGIKDHRMHIYLSLIDSRENPVGHYMIAPYLYLNKSWMPNPFWAPGQLQMDELETLSFEIACPWIAERIEQWKNEYRYKSHWLDRRTSGV